MSRKSFADVRAILFWHEIYYAKLRPDAGSQSGSRFRRGLWSQSPWIIHEYDLSTVIAT